MWAVSDLVSRYLPTWAQSTTQPPKPEDDFVFTEKKEVEEIIERQTSKTDHVVFLTIGSRGDVQPFIALGRYMQEEKKHTVTIATHAEFEGWVRSNGLGFKPVSGDPAALMRLCIQNNMFTRSFINDALTNLDSFLTALLETAWEACKDADVLVATPSALAGQHIAEKIGKPFINMMPFPWTPTTEFAHPMATMNFPAAGQLVATANFMTQGSFNRFTFNMIDGLIWYFLKEKFNRWRKNTLGLEPLTSAPSRDLVPMIYPISERLLPKPHDWGDLVHLTGFCFLEESVEYTPSPELASFLSHRPRPIVYIGFGSIVVDDPDSFERLILAAVASAGVRAIVARGWSRRGAPVTAAAAAAVGHSSDRTDGVALDAGDAPSTWQPSDVSPDGDWEGNTSRPLSRMNIIEPMRSEINPVAAWRDDLDAHIKHVYQSSMQLTMMGNGTPQPSNARVTRVWATLPRLPSFGAEPRLPRILTDYEPDTIIEPPISDDMMVDIPSCFRNDDTPPDGLTTSRIEMDLPTPSPLPRDLVDEARDSFAVPLTLPPTGDAARPAAAARGGEDVFFIDQAPHAWLFARVDAVVHHGGVGTTAAGLRLGRPTAIAPYFGDQYFWGRRVVEMGVGVVINSLDTASLARALVRIVKDTAMKSKAAALGEEIRKEDGVKKTYTILMSEINRYQQRELNSVQVIDIESNIVLVDPKKGETPTFETQGQ